MSVAKRHHTVPQFYLRGFSSNDRLATVRLPGTQRFVQSVRKAAAEMNFYAVDGHKDGSDAVEKLLASIEGEAAKVFGLITDGVWPLKSDDRGTLAYFIALQAVRGPEQRRNMEHLAAQLARLEIGYGGRTNVASWIERNRGISVSEKQAEVIWHEATGPEGPPIRIQPIAHVEQMVELSDALLPYIAGRPWTLVRFDERSLVTCDTPVGLVPHGDREPRSGVGFMTAWGITYPLTCNLGLLMSDPMVLADAGVTVDRVKAGTFDGAEAGTARMQRLFNNVTIASASLWVYHHPEDERLLPDALPEPTPVTMKMAGAPMKFSGEPMTGSVDADGVDESLASE